MKLKPIFIGMLLSISVIPVSVHADDTCKRDNRNDCQQSSGGWFSSWWIFNNSGNRGRSLGTRTSVDTEAYGSHSSLSEHAGFGAHAAAHGGGEGGE